MLPHVRCHRFLDGSMLDSDGDDCGNKVALRRRQQTVPMPVLGGKLSGIHSTEFWNAKNASPWAARQRL